MRHLKTPPFETKDSGWGSFTVPIDLFFKIENKHFKKTRINYKLVLQPNKDVIPPTDPAFQQEIKWCRREKIKFPGSVEEGFRRRLLRGGGKCRDVSSTDRKDGKNAYSTDKKNVKKVSNRRDRSMDREISKERERSMEGENEEQNGNEEIRDQNRHVRTGRNSNIKSGNQNKKQNGNKAGDELVVDNDEYIEKDIEEEAAVSYTHLTLPTTPYV